MQPLFDLEGRVMSIGGSLSAERVIDALLRMQNSTNWTKPITVYLGLVDRVQQPGVGPFEAVQICTLLRHIRVPVVRTVGIGGLLKDYEPMVLAAGTPGHRYLLRHSVLVPALASPTELPFPGPVPGLGQAKQSMREAIHRIHMDQIASLCAELAIPRRWENLVLPAEAAISAGFADALIREKTAVPNRVPEPTRGQTELSLEYQR